MLISAEGGRRSCVVVVLACLVRMTSEGYRLLLGHVYLRSWLKVLVTLIILLVSVLASKVRYNIATILLQAKILVNATAVDVVLSKCIEIGF